jgi:hypothetical protein
VKGDVIAEWGNGIGLAKKNSVLYISHQAGKVRCWSTVLSTAKQLQKAKAGERLR